MALDPEEFVTLTDHGSMKLRAAVLRAMTLLAKERKRTTIVREGKPCDPEFRTDQEPCGFVALGFNRAAPPKRRPVHGPVTPPELTQ